ncbi:uncharacterized protein CEXT_663021 [Caerostris extrusa]|uniref:Uncharacterized protein n=1 Tax=Caerostris extrusa TaxID=172846 RepID=A0AAV4MB73_CAEEX|nr:uncharacterized protein CEXT_663021 [Caerostris extrusa]
MHLSEFLLHVTSLETTCFEDGRVIADSGPQVTTKTKEDVRVEESENTEHKSTGDDPPGPGYELVPGSAKVISEKTREQPDHDGDQGGKPADA